MSGKILISACLAGHPVRYNGSAKPLNHPLIDQWRSEGRLVSVCPELMGGFSVPRPSAEIAEGSNGEAVLAGEGRVVEENGKDVTSQFIAGARAALAVARANDCRFALLIDGSPSCGSRLIYDGNFAGKKHSGAGVTATLLRSNGIEVFSDMEIEALGARICDQ
ncbi:DUF523 domain-containing protein [Brucella pseudogrignonensis]|uniref:Uncharacterized protein YbbK (DUF523 family) n=1 Tax=Brucella pseudogrignonensis TaxID=419475 RepID=A0ABU1M7U5_9HYPH|nr:DUF523 domain-containing protein [Brucella pseudogrignonensis]MDR6432089.1 uncharacterized protein YbbK (DUF523 family) [Brucella pseudogrignonensis]